MVLFHLLFKCVERLVGRPESFGYLLEVGRTFLSLIHLLRTILGSSRHPLTPPSFNFLYILVVWFWLAYYWAIVAQYEPGATTATQVRITSTVIKSRANEDANRLIARCTIFLLAK